MKKDQRLFYLTWVVAWIVLGCAATATFSYLPGSNAGVFNLEAWFAVFPLAWTIALGAVRYREKLSFLVPLPQMRQSSTSGKVIRWVLGGFGCIATLPFLFIGCATSAWLAPFSPKFQVEQDHGVHLPKSAIVLHRENSGVPWMDSHAIANVVISDSDLLEFVKQLEPAPTKYLFGGPWLSKEVGGSVEYQCLSKSSDGRFRVKVTPMTDGRTKIDLFTVTD